MWKWHCPSNPSLIWEYHDQKNALESIAAHVGGLGTHLRIPELLGDIVRPSCELTHELVDDGEPCPEPSCKIPYVRESSSSERR